MGVERADVGEEDSVEIVIGFEEQCSKKEVEVLY